MLRSSKWDMPKCSMTTSSQTRPCASLALPRRYHAHARKCATMKIPKMISKTCDYNIEVL
eukprot:6458723-Amphidinium_carterae.1